jgi:CVNH domain
MRKRVSWGEEDLSMPPSHRRLRVLAPACLSIAFALGCVAYRSDHGDDGYQGERIPEGSYHATCEGIRMDGYRLKASCGTERGTWRRSSLDVRACDGDIVNQDGYLRCVQDDRYYGGLPPGSYIRSCTNVKVRRGQLEADCRRDDHRWQPSRIAANACRRFRNRDGRLACE